MNLAELMFARKGRDSYATLAARCGNRIGANRLQQLATQPMLAFPDPDTMDAIAAALGVDFSTVLISCAESLGRHVSRHGSRLGQMLPARVDDLPQRQQDHILETARMMVEMLPDEPTPAQSAAAHIRKSAAKAVARNALSVNK